ncbi:MAG: 50S ribosomal protein L18 [Candidatus Lloydbacteria bacterium RIFOXYC12_FULL_46_25]|uniref:Large ribosomal subunit protein uL18 n=1 Tax=Candidatus Lloydbacteria bacterium RIFOXYC12_FULL_46_25 TaxID=1798670 RepID=A0A1G2DSK3_9BACT|nr:MAG: 50S ribosomal protein L18 [Candidatus Lloydbacteria bacterium RIFOXYC12_FULL_46_25]
MNKTEQKNYHRMRRHNRIRARVSGTAEKPRLAVFRSARFITAQLIDDTKGVTLIEASDLKAKTGTKMERASVVGKAIAEKAKGKKITHVVFDRGGFLYTGRVKSLADAAREGGLTF